MDELERDSVTVLYVDDEELARKYFVRAVEADYTVLAAASVDAAQELLAQRRVDILVTDYRMPRRAGGDLLRHVELHHPHIVRILVTAYPNKQVLFDTVNAGAIFRILEKPLDLDAVRATLRLAGARARERSARQGSLMAIEETLAFLAHELHAPLTAIGAFARGIQRRADGAGAAAGQAEIARAAGLMGDNARYCQAVLATLLGSVQRAGSASGGPGRRSAGALLAALLDSYPLTPAQRAMVDVEVRQDFPVAARPNCVALVLSSLLGNALRALDGRPVPALSFTVLSDGGGPQIRVTDNGPGIAPEALAALLADPATPRPDGSGWGLAFCQRVMQSFGGDILIHSDPGRHTTVILNFPAKKED